MSKKPHFVTINLTAAGYHCAKSNFHDLREATDCELALSPFPSNPFIVAYTRDAARVNILERFFGAERVDTTWEI